MHISSIVLVSTVLTRGIEYNPRRTLGPRLHGSDSKQIRYRADNRAVGSHVSSLLLKKGGKRLRLQGLDCSRYANNTDNRAVGSHFSSLVKMGVNGEND